MQDCNQKHMLVSERAPTAEGGYQETNLALHSDAHTNSDTRTGLCENIPKQGDVGHVIYFVSAQLPPQQDFGSNCTQSERREGSAAACSRFSNKEQSKMIKCGYMFI